MSNFSNTEWLSLILAIEWLFLIVAIVFLVICLIGKAYQFGYAKGKKDRLTDVLREELIKHFTGAFVKIVGLEITGDGICRVKFTTNRPDYFSKDA